MLVTPVLVCVWMYVSAGLMVTPPRVIRVSPVLGLHVGDSS